MAAPEFVSALLASSAAAARPSSSQAAALAFSSCDRAASNAAEQGRRLVLAHGEDAVLSDLQQLAAQVSPLACKALRAVLVATRTDGYASPAAAADAATCGRLRSRLAAQLPAWVAGLPLDAQQLAADLVAALCQDVEQLPDADVATLVNACLASLEQGAAHCTTLLELLGPCLVSLSSRPAAAGGAGPWWQQQAAADDEATPDEPGGAADAAALHVSAAVHRLQQAAWRPEHASQLLQVLRGLPLNAQQLTLLLRKGFNTCRTSGLQQLPPILYQLLLLAAAGGLRSLALKELHRTFKELERQPEHQQPEDGPAAGLPSTTLLQVQATLLMHISTLLKYDAALGNEWLKHFRVHGITSSHYTLQVLLAMGRQHKLEQPVQQLLKKGLITACEQAASQASSGGSSRWLASLPRVAAGPSLQDLQAGLLKAVRCSTFASELVCPGLLALATALLATPCSCPLHLVLALQSGALPPQASAGARAVHLGLQLLQGVFERHAEARGEVLKVCQAQLACSNLDSMLPGVLLLVSICRQQPALLASHVGQLKDCLAAFGALPADAALVLLRALWPLCLVRSDLQDHVVMLLRKLMYRQDVAGRLVAIRGFLCLVLQHLADAAPGGGSGGGLVAGSDPSEAGCSQASLSQVASLSSAGINLLQELTGVLRRALSQQAPVRQALYAGLQQVLAADPGSREQLAELLLPHLREFVADGEAQLPPLQLHRCAAITQGEATLLEPLPALLSCVHKLVSQMPPDAGGSSGGAGGDDSWQDAGDHSSSAALKACFASITARLARCEVEHFDLGSAADLAPSTPNGLLGQLHAASLLGCVEVAMEEAVGRAAVLRAAQPDPEARDGKQVEALGRQLLSLFHLHKAAYALALEGSRGGGAKKGRGRGAAAAAAAAGSQAITAPEAGEAAQAGAKRARPCAAFTPPQRLAPQLSAPTLAALCRAVTDDGLLALPASYVAASGQQQACGAGSSDAHAQLAREPAFRAFVLRSCANLLEGAQVAAAAAALLGGGGDAAAAPAAAEVLQLGPALYETVVLVMQTAGLGGRSCGIKIGGGANASGRAGGASASSSAAAAGAGGADGTESLEHLAAKALLQLLRLADETQQLGPLLAALPPLDGGSGALGSSGGARGDADMADAPAAAAPGGGGDAAGAVADGRTTATAAAAAEQPGADAAATAAAAAAAAAAAEAAAIHARLPQLQACVDKLLAQACFREAHTAIDCLVLLGRRLGAARPAAAAGARAAAAGAGAGTQAAAGQPRDALLSAWAERALQQEEPEVKHVPLARALLDVYIRFHATDDISPLRLAVEELQSLIGNTNTTQPTQARGAQLARLTAERTAQPCMGVVLSYCDECVGQIERLAGASLKAGMVQEGESAGTSEARARLVAALCKRLRGLVGVLHVVVTSVCGSPTIVDQQVRVLTRAYKLLTLLAKAYQLPKACAATGGPGWRLAAEFEGLVAAVHQLTPDVHAAVTDLVADKADGDRDGEGAPQRGASLSRIKREAKLIPPLVHATECWEKQLVATGKAANRNLMRDAKRTAPRDFKFTLGAAAGAAAAAAAGAVRGGRGAGGAVRAGRAAAAAAAEGPASPWLLDAEAEEEEEVAEEEEAAAAQQGDDDDGKEGGGSGGDENEDPHGGGGGKWW